MQGEEGDGLPQQSNEMVEFGWTMIKVSNNDANAQNMDGNDVSNVVCNLSPHTFCEIKHTNSSFLKLSFEFKY